MVAAKRGLIPALASALVLGAGITAATPAGAASAPIAVLGGENFSIVAGDVAMGGDEFLQILQTNAQLGTYTVRMWNDADDAPGNALLIGAGSCLPSGVPVAQVVCTFATPPASVSVDFAVASGPTNVAVMDNAPIALDFRGSSGVDYVQGGSGNDTLRGFSGNDLLFGGDGDDLIDGGSGNDYIEGEAGRDDMRGGSGRDTLEAADGIADVRVDCGGEPEELDFDRGKDVPVNCEGNPTPLPPAPVEPIDPPAPGEGDGTVDGAPTNVDVGPTGDDTKSVTISTGPLNPLFQSNLWWFGTPSMPPVPTFPPLFSFFEVNVNSVFPGSVFDISIFPPSPFAGPVQARSVQGRSGPVATESYTANANGVVRARVPIPRGMDPGDYTVQFNGITTSGAQMTVNVGVRLDQATPAPEPEPTETITITSAKRGKGKKAAVITVRGTTEGLSGTSVTPRYRVQGAKKWTTVKPVRVNDQGAFRFRVKTPKRVAIVVRSGAVSAQQVKVAAVTRR